MKKNILLFALCAFAFIGCNQSNVENKEMWSMTEFTSQEFSEDTVYTFDGGNAMVETYYDKYLKNNFLRFTRWHGREAMDEWFVNENGVLYNCAFQPTKYFEASDGKMEKSPWYKKEYYTDVKNKSNYVWRKENEERATLTYNHSDGKTTYIFKRDHKNENN